MKHTTNKFGPFLATIAAVIVAGAACSKDTTTTAPLVATSINANAGSSGQTGAISHALAAPVSVHVSDQSANAMAGAIVTWTVVGPGGSVDSATSTTNATGDAITHWTLGSTVGMQTLHATIVGGSFVSITASAVAGAATLLAKVSGDTQTVATGGAVSAAMVVKLTDALGNPVIGATITWASAAGTLSAASTTTDSTGKAHVTLTTAAGAQLYTITATSSGIAAVTFTITSPTGAGVAAFVAKVSGDTQTVAAGGSVSAPMVVKVTDIFGNPVVGTTVAWTSVTGTLSAASTTTDVNGKAQVTLTTAAGAQTYSVAATVTGIAAATFTITAPVVPGPAALLVKVSGDSQTVASGGAISQPMVVKLTDALGNAIVGATVTWATASGTLSATSTTTDINGKAQVTLTTAVSAQTYSITASAIGVPTVKFTITGT
jgi:adhesin/invasin